MSNELTTKRCDGMCARCDGTGTIPDWSAGRLPCPACKPMVQSEAVTAGAIRQSIVAAGRTLNDVAAECHEVAVARGKHPDNWIPLTGREQLEEDTHEWFQSACMADFGDEEGREKWRESEAMELGDLLATVLSIAHHRRIDVEAALRDAMQRNQERAERDE